MRAVVHEQYGPPSVLRVADVARPTPAADEVLVRVNATTVNRTDCGFRRPEPFFVRAFSGLRRPKRPILGTEFAGVVEAVGASVTQFRTGERVFGVNADHFGAHAEFVCVKAGGPIATTPPALADAEAAAVFDGGILALTYLRKAKVGPGSRVMVYGASGSIGTAAVQLAKHLGAEVTAVCDTAHVDVVRSLGPDAVIDYTVDDFARPERPGDQYDVVFDAVGKISLKRCAAVLKRGGVYASTDFGPLAQNPFLALATAPLGRTRVKRVQFPLPKYTQADVRFLADLVEAGEYRPVIDRSYPLEDVVDATEYVETEQKTGNVVLVVTHDDAATSPDSLTRP